MTSAHSAVPLYYIFCCGANFSCREVHFVSKKETPYRSIRCSFFGADDEARTRYHTPESGASRGPHLELKKVEVAGIKRKAPLLKRCFREIYGADDEARTRYLHLGKVALYQMSYIRILRCRLCFSLTTLFIITGGPR